MNSENRCFVSNKDCLWALLTETEENNSFIVTSFLFCILGSTAMTSKSKMTKHTVNDAFMFFFKGLMISKVFGFFKVVQVCQNKWENKGNCVLS